MGVEVGVAALAIVGVGGTVLDVIAGLLQPPRTNKERKRSDFLNISLLKNRTSIHSQWILVDNLSNRNCTENQVWMHPSPEGEGHEIKLLQMQPV